MKKGLITTTLLAAMTLPLVACSSGPTWVDEQAKIMKDHLYGYVLPYVDSTVVTVAYDETYGEVIVTADNKEVSFREAYKDAMVKDGWAVQDISKENYYDQAGTIYFFNRTVDYEGSDRVLWAYLYGLTDEEIDYNGSFTLEAYCPYIYGWPEDEAHLFAAYASSEIHESLDEYVTPPEFTADYYQLSSRDWAIFCYVANPKELDDCGYSEILDGEGWDVLEEKDDYGYYVAISPRGDYQISYLYDYDYGDLDIYFEEYEPLIPYDSWQSDLIEGFFEDWGEPVYEIPSIDVTDGVYYFTEDEDNFYRWLLDEPLIGYVDVHGATVADYTAYLDKLENDYGWKVEFLPETDNTVADATKVLEGNDHKLHVMSISYDEDYEYICLTYYMTAADLPYEEWPEAQVAEIVAEYSTGETDSLPAYEGENAQGFIIHNNTVQIIPVDIEDVDPEDTCDTIVEEYVALLVGWTPVEDEWGDTCYISPNEEFCVFVDNFWGEFVQIYITYVE